MTRCAAWCLAAWPTLLGATLAETSRPQPNVLALGDSYTVGEGVRQAQSWPFVLSWHLATETTTPNAAPDVLAQTGWTTDELLLALDAATSSPSGTPPAVRPFYPLVFLSIGVNDQYRGRPLSRFEAGFTALLKRAIGLANNNPQRVVVVSIPDWGQSPFAVGRGANRGKISTAIDRFNTAKRLITEQAGAGFVDITSPTRAARASEYAADGLHPGATIYQRWSQQLLSAAAAILNHPDPCQTQQQ